MILVLARVVNITYQLQTECREPIKRSGLRVENQIMVPDAQEWRLERGEPPKTYGVLCQNRNIQADGSNKASRVIDFMKLKKFPMDRTNMTG